jgi:hypothetical protein
MAKHLPRKHKAWILNLTTAEKKKKKETNKIKKKKEKCALSSSLFFENHLLWKGHLAYS